MRMFEDCPFLSVDPDDEDGEYIWCTDVAESTAGIQNCNPGSRECYLMCMIERVKKIELDIKRSKFGGFRTYQEYLKSDHWQEFRLKALENYGNKCALDKKHTENLNVHHNNYDNLGHETMQDVIVLCKNCHTKFHDKEV